MANVRQEVINRLDKFDIRPNERLGQHILVDPGWLGYIANQAYRDAHVIEIGAGPGNLTELIAPLAATVTAVEIDRRYEPMLQAVQEEHTNVTYIIGDALQLNYWQFQRQSDRQLQVIANIPYHISEPLMNILRQVPIEEAVITVGDKLSETLRETNPMKINFTKLSFMALGFFDVDFLGKIPKSAFYPSPRTDSHVIRITPKRKDEASAPGIRVIQQLFINGESGSVGNILRTILQGDMLDGRLRDKEDRHRHDRREARRELQAMVTGYNRNGALSSNGRRVDTRDPISRIEISEQILINRFSKLNNDELKRLAQAILDVYPVQ